MINEAVHQLVQSSQKKFLLFIQIHVSMLVKMKVRISKQELNASLNALHTNIQMLIIIA